MMTIRLSIALVGIVIAGSSATPTVVQARDDDEASKALDRKYDSLLAAARKDPKKADWQALRHAFRGRATIILTTLPGERRSARSRKACATAT